MKTSIASLLTLGLSVSLSLAQGPLPVAQNPGDLEGVVVPRKTEIFVEIGRTVDSKTAQEGDKFFGKITVPVTINDRIVLPIGTYVIGHVVEASRAKRLRGKAELQLNWDTVILPSGVTRNIQALVAGAEGYSGRDMDEHGKITKPGSQAGEVAKGAGKGGVSGATIGGIATRSWGGAGVGAAVGAGAGALFSLFKRGDEVVLAKGASLTIQLENDVTFVSPQAPRATVRLDNDGH